MKSLDLSKSPSFLKDFTVQRCRTNIVSSCADHRHEPQLDALTIAQAELKRKDEFLGRNDVLRSNTARDDGGADGTNPLLIVPLAVLAVQG